jgi:hypothetical protein
MARGISLNDESIIAPRLRKDQREKIRTLVRTNSNFPLVALGLVRDALKGYPEAKTRISDDSDSIIVTMFDQSEKIYTDYAFNFKQYIKIEAPTLED